MADNTQLNAGTGGDSIASDDIGGVKFQRVKLIHGADGVNAGDVATGNPLPIATQNNGLVSTANSTANNLAGAAVFTGTAEDLSEYATIAVSIFASHASATDGFSMQQSSNGTNWDIMDTYTIPATTGKIFEMPVGAKFFRLVYTNGATLTTSLRIQTLYHKSAKQSSSIRPQDSRPNDNDMTENLSYLMGYNQASGSWDRLRSNINGGLQVQFYVRASFRASTTALLVAPVTTPAPFFTIYGSNAGKVVRIQKITISGLTLTAVGYLNIGLRRYSTNPTGGTSTLLTQVSLDPNSGSPSVQDLRAYTVVPTAGTVVGDLMSRRTIGQAATAAAAGIPQTVEFDFTPGEDSQEGILRASTNGYGLYWITGPASAVSMLIDVQWSEDSA